MNKLRPNCLNFTELLAQNIALISPTMTAALIVPLMFGTTGSISWLSYAVGAVLVLFVALSLNQFARRTTNSGSMYSYAMSGLGFTGGSMCGWCLLWAYLFIGLAGTTGFTVFATNLLQMVHVNMPPVFLFFLCLGTSFFLGYKDIVISTLTTLALEAFSITFIMVLAFIVLGHHHFAIDTSQFSLKGTSLLTLGMGAVVAIFSLVGFESSTAFGEEAINPLKTIPRSVIWSLVITATFFVFITYVEVQGTAGYSTTLDKIDSPLTVLSQMYGVPFLGPITSAGAMFSFFALASSCMNAGARVMFAMGRHEFFPVKTGIAHPKYGTPHVALTVMAIVMFSVVTICYFVLKANGFAVVDEFNDAGTMGAFGFVGAYSLIVLAAPAFLKKRGELQAKHVVLCVVAMTLLLIPIIGSVWPIPAPPVNAFPYVFLGYLWFGLIQVMSMQHQKPQRVAEVGAEVRALHTEAGVTA
ncbi:MAG TPA: APC family permease [Candidatus Acidoferrum sp.]|jgi:amino acid transporter|nr:APC family permease [Candidatus Acidoferrum sp.]